MELIMPLPLGEHFAGPSWGGLSRRIGFVGENEDVETFILGSAKSHVVARFMSAAGGGGMEQTMASLGGMLVTFDDVERCMSGGGGGMQPRMPSLGDMLVTFDEVERCMSGGGGGMQPRTSLVGKILAAFDGVAKGARFEVCRRTPR